MQDAYFYLCCNMIWEEKNTGNDSSQEETVI